MYKCDTDIPNNAYTSCLPFFYKKKLKITCVTQRLHIMQREIKYTWFYQHSPEIIWDYLTKPELLSQWLMENNFQPIVGYEFQFNAKPKVKIGFEVLFIVKCRRLFLSSGYHIPGKADRILIKLHLILWSPGHSMQKITELNSLWNIPDLSV